MRRPPLPLIAFLLVACGPPEGPRDVAISSTPSASHTAPVPPPVVISVVGTNDLHGRVFALPLLGGYLENLRRVREASGGGVLLVDGGDMYQGTLESNLLEGLPVRDAYTALGYNAVTLGNHEFDFGPLGPNATPRAPGDDPRGALIALSSGAPYPFLAANVVDKKTLANVDWKNVRPSAMVEIAGNKIGLVGVTTEDTMKTTIAPNVVDLATTDLAKAIETEAKSLRTAGARAVVVLAHAGGKCQSFKDDLKTDSCEEGAEIFKVARALPRGLVDVIVAGHTHAGLAHTVNDIAIIESFSYGRAFGRVDLTLDGSVLVAKKLFPPRDLCPEGAKADLETCAPGEYEGKPVTRSATVEKAITASVANAKGKRGERIGTRLVEVIKRAYDDESALGNLFADLLREAAPNVDAAFMNGGGLRADLAAGELSYGTLFESFPFDNRIATAKLSVKDLKALLAAHIGRSGGILSLSGITLRAECAAKGLAVELFDNKGKALKDERVLTILGSDFIFLGGDAFWGDLTPPPIEISDELMRDALERGLKKRKELRSSDVFDPKTPRFKLKGKRPLSCR
jgi:2',3'-cyclic-nucleotide 2'-phosphodiesterase (5'-nucleotidase family)